MGGGLSAYGSTAFCWKLLKTASSLAKKANVSVLPWCWADIKQEKPLTSENPIRTATVKKLSQKSYVFDYLSGTSHLQ